jgi:hypothetical protein
MLAPEFEASLSVAVRPEARIHTKHPAADANTILRNDPNLRIRPTRKVIIT